VIHLPALAYDKHVEVYGEDADTWGCWKTGFTIGAAAIRAIVAAYEGALIAALGVEAFYGYFTETADDVRGCFD